MTEKEQLELKRENIELKRKIELLTKQLSQIVTTAENEYTDSPTHLKLKQEVELYKSLLDSNKIIIDNFKKEHEKLTAEIERLNKKIINPYNNGRRKREQTETGQEIILQMIYMLREGKSNKQMMSELYQLPPATFYRYKKLAKERMVKNGESVLHSTE